jgi:aminoglycoside phosphotransferase (APT) family kinase protein
MSKLDLGHISRLLEANGIKLEHWEEPRQGMINQTLIINHRYVLRADIFQPDVMPSRYEGEIRAYEHLRALDIPVPDIITLDASCQLVPLPYMLMTRLPGTPAAFVWSEMTPDQHMAVATRAGEILAQIHSVILASFGWLSDLKVNPMASAVDLTGSMFYWHLEEAYRNRSFDAAVRARLVEVWERVKPYVAQVRQPHLIHRDFQFENILVENGRVTGIIDFEWGAAGDAAWDFMVEDRWEKQCPGSVKYIYAGYQSMRPLPTHLRILKPFYRLLMLVDLVANAVGDMSNRMAVWRSEMMEELLVLEKMEF